MSPSEKLGVLAPWAWIVDLSPGVAFFVMLFISPLAIKFVILPVIEGRILRWRDNFLTFNFDMFFAPTLACALVLVRAMPDRVYLSKGNVLHWVFLLIAISIGVVHYLQERKFYSWKQMTSFSKIYHELLFPFVGYLLLTVCLFGLIFAPWTFAMIVMRLIMLASITTWALTWPLYDEDHKLDVIEYGQDRYWYAHVDDAWPWQHKYRYLGDWWKRYAASWKGVPAYWRSLYNRVTA